MVHKDGLCVSYCILAFSIIITSGFAIWLYKDTDLIKYTDFTTESRKLKFYARYEDNLKLRNEILEEIFDDEIDIAWMPFVQDEPDGYVKLQLYSRLLAGNPDHEEIYEQIGHIIESAPGEYPSKQKIRYLTSLKAITGIQNDLLEKYGLLIIADNR